MIGYSYPVEAAHLPSLWMNRRCVGKPLRQKGFPVAIAAPGFDGAASVLRDDRAAARDPQQSKNSRSQRGLGYFLV